MNEIKGKTLAEIISDKPSVHSPRAAQLLVERGFSPESPATVRLVGWCDDRRTYLTRVVLDSGEACQTVGQEGQSWEW